MPGPVSCTSNQTRSACSPSRHTCRPMWPRSVNFSALPSRLATICPSLLRSPSTTVGAAQRELALQRQALGARVRAVQRVDVAQLLQQVERRGQHLQAAGLDLGQVEHVVDQAQQAVAGAVDHAQARLRLVRQLAVGHQQLREAQHRVQRRADLVAHVGQEHALAAVGALGLFLGGLERGDHAAALADVAQHRLQQVVAVVAEQADRDLGVELACRRGGGSATRRSSCRRA